MTNENPPGSAPEQLNLVLGFFDRVDTKLSVVLGLDVGMLGVVASQAPSHAQITLLSGCCLAAFLVCCAYGSYHLYRGSFPRLDGDEASLVYFHAVAQRPEAGFRNEFLAQTAEGREHDVVGQVWHNARILSEKFCHLRCAYQAMALSLIPWAATLGLFAMKQGNG